MVLSGTGVPGSEDVVAVVVDLVPVELLELEGLLEVLRVSAATIIFMHISSEIAAITLSTIDV